MMDGRTFDEPAYYKIKIHGCLDPKWSDWFDGFTINSQPNCVCVLKGLAIDQAALHGMLAKIRDLGLPLLALERISVEEMRLTGDHSYSNKTSSVP